MTAWRIAVGALGCVACASAPLASPVEPSDSDPIEADGGTQFVSRGRRPVEPVLVSADALPRLASVALLRSATAEIAIRPMFFAENDPRARPVELSPSSKLGYVALGPRTGWRGGSWSGVRAGLTAFCGTEPPIAIQPAKWLTIRPRSEDSAVDVRMARGDFDGRRCALMPEIASSVAAPVLSADVPLYAYRACDDAACGDESLVLVFPGVANLLVESDAHVTREEGPFTILFVPLGQGSTSIVARVRQKDASLFREDLGLPPATDLGDRELAIEVTQSRSDTAPVIAVFVTRPTGP